MTTTLAPLPDTRIQRVIDLVTDAVTSPHTQRAYGRALGDFIAWYQAAGAQIVDMGLYRRLTQPRRACDITAVLDTNASPPCVSLPKKLPTMA